MNYNNELEMFKKGSLLYRNVYPPMSAPTCIPNPLKHESMIADASKQPASHFPEKKVDTSEAQRAEQTKKAATSNIVLEHTDIIKNNFWEGKPWLLPSKEH